MYVIGLVCATINPNTLPGVDAAAVPTWTVGVVTQIRDADAVADENSGVGVAVTQTNVCSLSYRWFSSLFFCWSSTLFFPRPTHTSDSVLNCCECECECDESNKYQFELDLSTTGQEIQNLFHSPQD